MLPETDILTSIVSRVLRIEDVTLGAPPKSFIIRYRGQLYGDSAAAYDQLAESATQLRNYPPIPAGGGAPRGAAHARHRQAPPG